jgi:hypothetical protein
MKPPVGAEMDSVPLTPPLPLWAKGELIRWFDGGVERGIALIFGRGVKCANMSGWNAPPVAIADIAHRRKLAGPKSLNSRNTADVNENTSFTKSRERSKIARWKGCGVQLLGTGLVLLTPVLYR